MDNAAFLSLLRTMNACPDAVKWVDGLSLREAYEKCEHADWMLTVAMWMAGTPGWPSSKEVVSAVVDVVQMELPHISNPEGHLAVRTGIALLGEWIAGKVTTKDCTAAADDLARTGGVAPYLLWLPSCPQNTVASVIDIILSSTGRSLTRYADMVRAKLPCPDVGDTA